jgi:hypothetical protein
VVIILSPQLFLSALLVLFFAPAVVSAQEAVIDFGADTGDWVNDGECDDPRFEGQGSASVLLDEDLFQDASDCRELFERGQIRLRQNAEDGGRGGSIDFGVDTSTWAHDGECDDPRFDGDGSANYLSDANQYRDATDCRVLFNQGRVHFLDEGATDVAVNTEQRNRLGSGDARLSSGEYRDDHSFDGQRGQFAVIDLRSSEFDPYLIVSTPGGEQFDNDDYEGDVNRSLISFYLDETGSYEVTVTSYEENETGSYTLDINVDDPVASGSVLEQFGMLENGDETLAGGEYIDYYEIEGRPGQRVSVSLLSEEFDTFLVLIDPMGGKQENDDAGDSTDSMLVAELTETGTYRVAVTSYAVGETGRYQLSIDRNDSSARRPRDSRDVQTLTLGEAASGELEAGDQLLDDGKYQDIYVFDGSSGQSVQIDMRSTEFDTYLSLVTPQGDAIDNDDFNGSTSRSAIDLNLTETGRYRVIVTSYEAAEEGRYQLTVRSDAVSPSSETAVGDGTGAGRTYGIFAGISDYPGTDSDLDFTAEDAIRVRDAVIRGGGMQPEDAITLTDSDATLANVQNALLDIASRAGVDDTVVFFYSGHGGRVTRSAGPETSDPDSIDETLVLYDGEIRDDEMRGLLGQIEAGTTLVFLDSCFSGGFAKDIISVPGRMGMFSSEEDVTSQVAVKFRAGGYLSVFLDEAIGDRLADGNSDGSVTAIELSEYVHLRYRNDVKSADPNDFVRTRGPQSGYQHLVVDRGSVGPYDVLFTQPR